VSLRDARMLPDLALIDPALMDGAPRGVTLASGLDAVTQVIEPWLSTRANPMTDALCRPAIPRGLAALARLAEGEDARARDDMALVALTGGVALANAGLGAVHGLAGPLGGHAPGAAHGAICAALLPHVLAANAAAPDLSPETAARLETLRAMLRETLGRLDAGGGAAGARRARPGSGRGAGGGGGGARRLLDAGQSRGARTGHAGTHSRRRALTSRSAAAAHRHAPRC
jgi:hypothetical protein